MHDFNIMKASGFHMKGELDFLLGVSRITLYGYLKGAKPSKRREPRVSETLKVLSALVEKGQLPLPKDKPPTARRAAVEKIKAHVDARI